MSEGLIGVLIGSLIAFLSSIIPVYIKTNQEKSKIFYEKKEETYIQALNVVGKYFAEIPDSVDNHCRLNPEFSKEINRMYPLMMFYSTSEIYKKFQFLIGNIIESKMNTGKYTQEEIVKKIESFKDLLISDLRKTK